jgi:hypothetical protein
MAKSISVEGLVLPNKPLTNFELMDAVEKLKIPRFRGVFMRNNLPPKPRKRECGILNLDDASSRGTHWVAWYKNNKDKFYFDSFGVQPPNELIEYLHSPIFYNTERIQPNGQVFCGHLCLYVLFRLSRGENLQEIINDLY